MSRDTSMGVFWSVDAFRRRGEVVFVHGWVVSATGLPVEVTLETEGGAQGASEEGCFPFQSPLKANLCQARPDVARSFPQYPHAVRSGFWLYGALPSLGAEESALGLRVRWPDREDSWIPLHGHAACGGLGRRGRIALYVRQLWHWGHRAWAVGRSAGWRALLAKVKARWRAHVVPQGGRARLVERLRGLAGRELAVIVDHALGGGANLFRRRLVRQLLDQGGVVLLYFHDVATLRPMVTVSCGDRHDSYAVDGFADLLDAVKGAAVRKVVYNTAASLPDAAGLPWGMVELARGCGAELIAYLHDYFPICPSQYLLNDRGEYCGVPDDLSECQRCLRANQQGFAALYPGVEVSRWRSAWGAMLLAADRIVAFSRASRDILARAFPWLPGDRIEIVPHVVDHLPSRRVRMHKGDRLTVGIVGTIGHHKGAGVVRGLCYHAVQADLPVRFVVIGTLEAVCPPGVLVETGPYRHESLPALLERHGVSVVLFPSIWPETFSYVVQELIQLGLPIAAFDLGAPAERLAAYPKGLLLRERDPAQILQRLIAFWRTLPSDESENP